MYCFRTKRNGIATNVDNIQIEVITIFALILVTLTKNGNIIAMKRSQETAHNVSTLLVKLVTVKKSKIKYKNF